ncbi:MAG TPA: methyltransferase domain-containing protein, partial [Thiobacillaceae bacterium]|nr:methyltransferase domain-containing protein [Thiobacillaceae bacterium]
RIAGDYASGLNPERIRYQIHPKGLSGMKRWADLVISRAALEHVNDLQATFDDMRQAMNLQAWSVHQVDLKSHGLHRNNPLDFLTWPTWLWKLMYGYKGFPNRLRVDSYRNILDQLNLRIVKFKPTLLASQNDIRTIRPRLCSAFRTVSDTDLSWLGFWLVFRLPEA